ncbi:hypothetical protein A9Z42_0049440 [Trichoderma parareesei]|uniref:Uncharacterized protein n=1 Tax=Trichoderma parareesei TaxID=858221 RepID=A0A2H2ZES6_TRIPA|nr:hypothetical protein A9Z42_0049440 [Trichoderma parareesei]
MCEVELSICVHCGKVFAAKMKYCDPVKGKLLIHPTAILDACRSDMAGPEVPFDRPAAARPSARSPYPTPMAPQRMDMPEELPQAAGVEERRQGAAMMPLGSDVQLQLQLQMQIQTQTELPTGDTPAVGSPTSSWSGSTVSYY